MAALDLDSGFDLEHLGLPISNTENKILEAEVQKKQKEVSLHDGKIEENKERIQAISDHLKNVKQEFQHTQVCVQNGVLVYSITVDGGVHKFIVVAREPANLCTNLY